MQFLCTLLATHTAQALIVFGGDSGCMALGAALVTTIWTDPKGRLGRGGLRWGFLAIGACALIGALDTWMRAWRDPGQFPLGEIEGIGPSDASTLMEVHSWSAGALTVALGLVCLAALAAEYPIVLMRSCARCDDVIAKSAV